MALLQQELKLKAHSVLQADQTSTAPPNNQAQDTAQFKHESIVCRVQGLNLERNERVREPGLVGTKLQSVSIASSQPRSVKKSALGESNASQGTAAPMDVLDI